MTAMRAVHPAIIAPAAVAALLLATGTLGAADPPPAQDPAWGDVRVEAGGGAGTIRDGQASVVTPPGGTAVALGSEQRVRVESSRLALAQIGPISGDPRHSCLVVGYEAALERLAWSDPLGRWNSTRAGLDVAAGGALALGPRARLEALALAGAGLARWRFETASASAIARSPVVEAGLRADVVAGWRCGLLLGAGGQLLGDEAHASLSWTDAATGDADRLSEHARSLHGEAFALAGWRF
jgi:hypothetical protein